MIDQEESILDKKPEWMHALWQCRRHDNCFGTHHLNLAEVEAEGAKCADSCRCWRHKIVLVERKLQGLTL